MPDEPKDDPRIDPRVRALLAAMPVVSQGDVSSREEVVSQANSPEGKAAFIAANAAMAFYDNESVAPSDGLDFAVHDLTSSPDGNTVKLHLIRPRSDGPLPCVYYIHGGGMQFMSCFDPIYRAWGRVIANHGVAVASA